MADIHLMAGDTMRIVAPKSPLVLTLWNGDKVFKYPGDANIRARSRDDALTEGIRDLIFRPGRVTKRDLEALLEAASQAEHVIEVI